MMIMRLQTNLTKPLRNVKFSWRVALQIIDNKRLQNTCYRFCKPRIALQNLFVQLVKDQFEGSMRLGPEGDFRSKC